MDHGSEKLVANLRKDHESRCERFLCNTQLVVCSTAVEKMRALSLTSCYLCDFATMMLLLGGLSLHLGHYAQGFVAVVEPRHRGASGVRSGTTKAVPAPADVSQTRIRGGGSRGGKVRRLSSDGDRENRSVHEEWPFHKSRYCSLWQFRTGSLEMLKECPVLRPA